MLNYKDIANSNILNDIQVIQEQCPIKSTFTSEQILNKYITEQEIKVRRGRLRKHLLYVCMYSDVIKSMDFEKIKTICDAANLKPTTLINIYGTIV